MRFIQINDLWQASPTDGAIIPNLIQRGAEAAQDTASVVIGQYVHVVFQWLATNGIPLAVEALLVWAMMCFLISITGSGKWLERGAKAFLYSVLLGVIGHAV